MAMRALLGHAPTLRTLVHLLPQQKMHLEFQVGTKPAQWQSVWAAQTQVLPHKANSRLGCAPGSWVLGALTSQ